MGDIIVTLSTMGIGCLLILAGYVLGLRRGYVLGYKLGWARHKLWAYGSIYGANPTKIKKAVEEVVDEVTIDFSTVELKVLASLWNSRKGNDMRAWCGFLMTLLTIDFAHLLLRSLGTGSSLVAILLGVLCCISAVCTWVLLVNPSDFAVEVDQSETRTSEEEQSTTLRN